MPRRWSLLNLKKHNGWYDCSIQCSFPQWANYEPLLWKYFKRVGGVTLAWHALVPSVMLPSILRLLDGWDSLLSQWPTHRAGALNDGLVLVCSCWYSHLVSNSVFIYTQMIEIRCRSKGWRIWWLKNRLAQLWLRARILMIPLHDKHKALTRFCWLG